MQTLDVDTANQNVLFTLREGREYFDAAFTHYLLVIRRTEGTDAGMMLAQIPVVVTDNDRITELTITTVTLTTAGQYWYEVYGQNSDTNLDPTDASVVGQIEIGRIELIATDNTFVIPEITLQNDFRG